MLDCHYAADASFADDYQMLLHYAVTFVTTQTRAR